MTSLIDDGTLVREGFNTFHRCDRCGAQASHRATKAKAASELLFCNHHYNEYRDGLIDQYWLIESDDN